MKKLAVTLLIGIAVILALGFLFGRVNATAAPKYFVCKYTGKPGVDEVLQTGNNPISVSGNALPDGTQVGDSFADAQGRSYVIAEDTGQDEPECPVPENPEEPKEDPELPTPSDDEPQVKQTPVGGVDTGKGFLAN